MKKISLEQLKLLAFASGGNITTVALSFSIHGVSGGVDDERMFDKVTRPVV